MSLWNRLGELAKDAGNAALATPKFWWDVVSNTNDLPKKDFNGVKNVVVNAAKKELPAVVKPIADVAEMPGIKQTLETANAVARDAVWEPLTTAALLHNPFDVNDWKNSYAAAQHVALGQALVGSVAAAIPGQQDVEKQINDWNDQKQVDAYFDHGIQKWVSGTLDFGKNIFLDPTIVLGKAGKIARGASWATNKLDDANKMRSAIQGVQAAEDGAEANKYSKLLDTFVQNDSTFISNLPEMKDAPSPLVHALGQVKDLTDEAGNVLPGSGRKQAGIIYRAGLGDPNALADLRKWRPDLANPIGRSQGELDAWQQWSLERTTREDGMLDLPWENENLMSEIDTEMAALKANDKKFANYFALEEMAQTPGGSLSRSAGATPFQALNRFVAGGRTAKFHDLKAGAPNIGVYQPTPLHRMYQVVSWAAGERPAGILNLNDADSSREVSAVIQRAMKHDVLPGGEARAALHNYMGAATPEARAEQAYRLERVVFGRLAKKHGFDTEAADKMYNDYKRARSSAYDALKGRGYAVDIDGTVFKAPFFESQTANYLPMMDFDLADSLFRRQKLLRGNAAQKVAGAALTVGRDTIDTLDLFQSMFKVGALMRLGYTMRNGAEAQLRIASTAGALASFRHLPGGLKNLVYNTTVNPGNRLIDRMAHAGEGFSYEEMLGKLKEAKAGLSDADARIAQVHTEIENDRLKQMADWQQSIKGEPAYEGGTPMYHGTIERFPEDMPDDAWKSSAISQLYGNGFYTTDNFDVAKTYTNKGKSFASRVRDDANTNRAIYNVKWTGEQPPKMLDAEAAMPNDVRQRLAEIFLAPQKNYTSKDKFTLGDPWFDAEGYDRAAKALRDPNSTYADFYTGLRKDVTDQEVDSDAYEEMLGFISQSLFDLSYDGIRHTGGLATNSAIKHNVNIFFDTQKIKLENIHEWDGPTVVDNPDLQAKLEVMQNLKAEREQVYSHFNKRMADLEKKPSKKRMATGKFTYTGIDGTKYELDDAFAGPFGDIHFNNSSAENSQMNLVDNQAGLLGRHLVTKGFGTVTPDMPNYWMEWSTALNRYFGNSLVARKLANGESIEDVTKWLRGSPEGRNLRNRLGLDVHDASEYVATAKGLVDKHMPTDSLKARLVAREEITPEMLREEAKQMVDLPDIAGHVLENNMNLLGQRKLASITQGIFKMIGSMPEDAWARHPLYATFYRDALKQRIDAFTALNGRPVSQLADDMVGSSEMGLAMRAAHQDALRATKSILFTIDRKSNLASSTLIKFASPFFPAFENSVKTWAKIVANRPETANRAYLAFTAPNRAGIATDQNGNPVPVDQASMNDYIWVEVPEGMKKLPFVGKGLQSLDHVGIQKKSLDVVFQGETNIPVGPYVAIPVSQLVKSQPSLEQSMKWAIPFGPERNAATAMLPTWLKKQIIKNEGQDNAQYANTYTLIWQTEMHKARENGDPMPTAEDIKKKTDAYWNMRSVANLVLPFAPQFQTPYKLYIDQYRQLREKDPATANEKFWELYGDDFYDFTMSLSKNNTGSAATVTDVQNAKDYKDLVAQVGDIDPKMIGLITGAGRGTYEFSQAAYQWQLNNKISANSATKFRGSNDPAQALKENNASLGWIKYRQVMNEIDAVMQSRGITDINNKGAGDLAIIKKQMVQQLAKTNIDWYEDYKDTDGSKYIRTKRVFQTIMSDPKFMKQYGDDPTWKSISVYMQIRDEADKVLSQRKAAGGSGTLSAKSNADVAFFLNTTANQLKQQDIGFGDVYDRYFAYDPGFDPALSGAMNGQ